MTKGTADDPKGLIREAYRIDGISEPECRSIFLDWALSLPEGADTRAHIEVLLDRHGAPDDHPMTRVLREGMSRASAPKRRGGAMGRRN
ncbi:MAG: hypothetical protein CML50_21490 [Rhodobacteraceae bacterium]|jgi:hypothetical protein|uniref:Uncharacterized protein n=1 Tax=Salipiger profundus TaxID=1229727 RepID=A0A1U7DB58_9RHOB|nr:MULTISPECIES: hypothetical protein [Salipiger]APX25290.1 hypothetical protein Ga0080559_TMP4494 [Salipiger profundus]MAB08572.1 hypothetical protein [Paracoccaceae bacterium]GGA16620.1 hypothetical protein GCM10011326_31560 [Salipiger profundus]SFD05896.1 hypothetical protein SAMN05444415_1077 [Salipiger profundus]